MTTKYVYSDGANSTHDNPLDSILELIETVSEL